MVFTGFDIKFPEYEVITPQTSQSFHVRSLNVQEEENLKGSLVTPTKITQHLNKCLYDVIVKKPASVKDFDSFLKAVTLKDRDALLYGLYHITYEEIRNYDVTCSSCGKEYPVTIAASKTFNMTPYPEKNIISKRVKVPLPVSKGVTAIIKQPTLEEETKAIESLSSRPGTTIETITETLLIEKFEQDIPEQTKPKVFVDRHDIIDAFMSLPARDKRLINKEYVENFGKYGIDLKMQVFCQHCGHEEVVDIDIVANFFRSLYAG